MRSFFCFKCFMFHKWNVSKIGRKRTIFQDEAPQNPQHSAPNSATIMLNDGRGATESLTAPTATTTVPTTTEGLLLMALQVGKVWFLKEEEWNSTFSCEKIYSMETVKHEKFQTFFSVSLSLCLLDSVTQLVPISMFGRYKITFYFFLCSTAPT